MITPMDPRTAVAVSEAIRQKFRIELCAACGIGPEIFSKVLPLSKCLRCGARRDHLAVKQHKTSWRRCALCGEQTMAGIPQNRQYCLPCSRLSSHERAKRLRWKQEADAAPAQLPPKTSIESGGD
jgi:hypothetical protein